MLGGGLADAEVGPLGEPIAHGGGPLAREEVTWPLDLMLFDHAAPIEESDRKHDIVASVA